MEVDLEYPNDYHNRNDDYPFAPKILEISTKYYSEKHLDFIRKYFGRAAPWSKKIVCTLLLKRRYLVLGQLLLFYLQRGLKLVKIHRSIKFTTDRWIQPYI